MRHHHPWSLVAAFALLALVECGGDEATSHPTGDDAEAGAGGDDSGQPPRAGTSVLTFHNHDVRDGFYVDAKLTASAAATMHRDATFDGAVSGHVYGQPLYVENGPGNDGAFYVATESDNLFALDQSGKTIWQKNFGTPAQQSGAGCGNISPIGITGTPAIDLAARLIVFDGATAGNNGNIGTHVIHAVSIDDGSEAWKVDVASVASGNLQLVPYLHNQRSAVVIAGGWAYVAYGGHFGDCGDYHGWMVGVPLASGQGAKAWATPARGGGMWAPGGPSSDGTSVFMTTGNTAGASTWQGGEAVIRFGQGAAFSGSATDYFAPSNWKALDSADADLGGSGPVVVDAPAMTPSKLVVALGKDGNAYVLDRGNLGGEGATPVAQSNVVGGEIIQSAASATVGGTTYVALHASSGGGSHCPGGTSGDLVVVKLDPNAPDKIATVWCADNQGRGSPIITTSDGSHDALVWTAGAEGSGQLHAWDLGTGQQVLATAGSANKIGGLRRFTTLIAVKGRIFAGADDKLYAFTP